MWTNRPPVGDTKPTTRLVRAIPKRPIRAFVLSGDVSGTKTHYWHGRTRPCNAPDCDACTANNIARWHGYIAIYNTDAHEVQVLEITSSSIQYIERYLVGRQSLRGAHITASRPSGRITGKLHLLLEQTTDLRPDLPPAPNVRQILERIWHGDAARPAEAPLHTIYAAQIAQAEAQKNGLATQRSTAQPTRLEADRRPRS